MKKWLKENKVGKTKEPGHAMPDDRNSNWDDNGGNKGV